jgi:hypothetical protein
MKWIEMYFQMLVFFALGVPLVALHSWMQKLCTIMNNFTRKPRNMLVIHVIAPSMMHIVFKCIRRDIEMLMNSVAKLVAKDLLMSVSSIPYNLFIIMLGKIIA